ncbi:sensor domain-containing diguanylate cyclase [Kiloniella laminariae]|uniref:sensor domain-containing diguanylate cyclase n=1 Tax=Kiloniella laminariae TaxID=454162 RepID=UPI000369FA42|nr:diguanylate cyclase [Kiloniella laminariae]
MKRNKNPKIKGFSIRHKVAIVLLSTTLISIVLTGTSYHYRSQSELTELVHRHLVSVTSQISHQITQTIDRNAERMALIVSRTQLRHSLAQWQNEQDQGLVPAAAHEQKMRSILVDAQQAIPAVLSLNIVNFQGDVIVSTDPESVKNYSVLIREADLDEENSFQVFIVPVGEQNNKLVAFQQLLLNGRSLGILVLETDLSSFQSAVGNHTGLGESEEVFLVYRDSENKIRPFARPKYASTGLVELLINPFERSEADISDITRHIDYRGKEVFVITHVFPDLNWGLVFKIDTAEALESLNKQKKFLFYSLFASGFVVLIVALFLGRSITRPVIDLTSVAMMIAQGDLSRRIEYLSKDELGLLAKAFNKMADKLIDANKFLEQKIQEKTGDLMRANEHLLELSADLEKVALEDGITGIANRRAFDQILPREWNRNQRDGIFLSLILIDIDFFKQYNDALGHQAGDECLLKVARLLAAQVQRSGDLVARYGGEEFVMLLPNTNREACELIVERLQQSLESLAIPHPDSQVGPQLTVSLGAGVLIPERGAGEMDFIAAVDAALYLAKKQGRNRVVFAS